MNDITIHNITEGLMTDETVVLPVEGTPMPKPKKRKATKTAGKKPAKKKVKKKAAGNGKHLPVTQHTVPDSTKLTVVPKWRKDNPKSPMSPSAKRFELYKTVSTVGEYRALMRKPPWKKPHFANLDLARDKARGYIDFKIG